MPVTVRPESVIVNVILVSMETNVSMHVVLSAGEQGKYVIVTLGDVIPVLLDTTETYAPTHVAPTVLEQRVIGTVASVSTVLLDVTELSVCLCAMSTVAVQPTSAIFGVENVIEAVILGTTE